MNDLFFFFLAHLVFSLLPLLFLNHQTLVVLPLEKRREIIANIRKKCALHARQFAELAVEETGLGRVDDKIKKNLF